MRIGSNPEKDNKSILLENYHRVSVPVYIPNFEGYFEHSFDGFKLCIESLLKTVHTKTRITIYNNNCHPLVKEYIDFQYKNSVYIDQVFHSKENLGKINAVLAASKGNLEPLITITDADVLFQQRWQATIEDVFVNFPEAGMVSPVPSSKAVTNHTASTWFYGFFKGKLEFQKVLHPEAMRLFDLSLGNEKLMYDPIHLENYLVLKNKNNSCEAVVGCGHFVATLKRDVFDLGSKEPAFIKIDGGVEQKYIDIPNDSLGYLRLATKGNFAYHIGNKTEPWMFEMVSNLSIETSNGIDSSKIIDQKIGAFSRKIGRIILRIMSNKKTRNLFFKKFGLKTPSYY
jgi:hypothetical protein